MQRHASVTAVLAAVLYLSGAGTTVRATDGDTPPPPRLHGLEAGLAVENPELPLGSRLDVVVSLRFESLPSEASTRHLDVREGAWRFEFHAVDTVFTFYRDAVDIGNVAAEAGRDQVRLSAGWHVRFVRAVHLLSPDGEQVPPGRYDLYGVYLNTTPGASRGSLPSEAAWWSGEIASEPVRVTVRPADPEHVHIAVPRRVVVERDGDRLRWRWDSDSTRTVTVTRRPGYALGVQTRGLVRVSGEDTAEGWRDTRGIEFSSSAHDHLPDAVADLALAGEPLEVTVELEIFESSVPPQHQWRPERGDYRVLWRGEVRGAYR